VTDPAGILEAARRSLARIRPPEPGFQEWLRENVTDPLGQRLGEAIEALVSLGGTTLGTVLLWTAGVVAAGLLAWLAAALLRRGDVRRRARATDRVARASAARFDPDAAEAEAARLAAAGAFAEAVRHLYAATVGRLHLRGGRRFDPALTPAENLAPYRGVPYFPRLREFVRGYERASFGGRGLDAEGYRRLAAERPAEAAR